MNLTCDLPLDRSLPLVCICSLFSFLCGVGIGANDLSANFAMVVGSGSLNMRQAIIYCTVFELLGAAFMGGRVSGTIRKGIIDPVIFTESRDMVLIGMTCASFSAALWLYLSTVFGLPVSITHTVVGSIIGFAIFSTGSFKYVQFMGVIKIVISWIVTPIAAAAVTAGLFYLLRKYILKVKGQSFQNALWSLPYCLGFSLLIDFMFIFIEQPPIFTVTIAKFIPIGVQYIIMLLAIFLVCCFFFLVILPRLEVEAKERSSFVWESHLLRTEAEELSPTLEGATDIRTGRDKLRPSVLMPAVHKAGVAERSLPCLEETVGPQGGSALFHETDSFFLSTVEPSELRLLSHHRVRPTPVTRRLAPLESFQENKKLQSSVATSASTYGTLPEDTVETPVNLGADDVFMEEDWEMDHPMQPINFGGLLIKPFNPRAEYLFTALQVVVGSISSFVHGAVAGANATAAFIILYDTFAVSELNGGLLYSGWAVLPAMLGIAIGMFTLGARLMKTVGVELVTLTPARGWCIQAGGALVTMLLTGIGIPVSLSQAQVGSAIGCGLLDAQMKGVSWGIVTKIVCGWVVTLVIASVTTGLSMWILAFFYCA